MWTIRFPIIITGLPDEFKKQIDKTKSSEVKSLANSKFDQGRSLSTTLDYSNVK